LPVTITLHKVFDNETIDGMHFTVMHEFLTQVQKRPGLYFGNSEQPFIKLLAFMDGYSVGYEKAQSGDSSWPKTFVSAEFGQFVCQQMGIQHATDTRGWRTIIRECSSSEQEAFNLFFRLVEEYEKSQK
jgi:hypothetical protein